MSKKIIIYDNENVHSIINTIEPYPRKMKIWNPPIIILLKQFDIQSGSENGPEGSNGFWQSSLGS